MINLTACQYFLEVVRLGSIRLAADRLHVSPSAISRQLVKLERELDGQLIERHANGVKLTEAGEAAAKHFADIFDQINLVKGEISSLQELKSGRISIATVEGISDPFLSEQIGAFRKRFPAVEFQVRICGRERVLEALEQRLCQIGFVYDHFSHPAIEIAGQWRQPLLALAPPSHPLASLPKLELTSLVDVDCVLPDDSFGIHHLVKRTFKKIGAEPKPIIIANQLHFLIRHAIRHNAIVYAPLQAAIPEVEAGELIPLNLHCPEFEHRSIYAIARREQIPPPACRAFTASLVPNFPKYEKQDTAMLQSLRMNQA